MLRELLQSKGCQRPPAALLKAVIINGADRLPGIDIVAQGFGRVNIQASAAMLEMPPLLANSIFLESSLSSVGGTLIGAPLKQGEECNFILAPVEDYSDLEFKITMVYNDPPGGQI